MTLLSIDDLSSSTLAPVISLRRRPQIQRAILMFSSHVGHRLQTGTYVLVTCSGSSISSGSFAASKLATSRAKQLHDIPNFEGTGCLLSIDSHHAGPKVLLDVSSKKKGRKLLFGSMQAVFHSPTTKSACRSCRFWSQAYLVDHANLHRAPNTLTMLSSPLFVCHVSSDIYALFLRKCYFFWYTNDRLSPKKLLANRPTPQATSLEVPKTMRHKSSARKGYATVSPFSDAAFTNCSVQGVGRCE